MIQDIRFHGQINPKVEYYAIVSGSDITKRYFQEINSTPSGDIVRFFSGTNEFIIDSGGISYKGTGGSFCQYMFGVDQPIKDLVKADVLNRLVMYGAIYSDIDERIIFTNNTEGRDSFDKVFLSGNAVINYYFFIHSNLKGELRRRQEEILRVLGKYLKRSEWVGIGDDSRIIRGIHKELRESKSILFLFKLLNKHNEEYYNLFRESYYRRKAITKDEEGALEVVAEKYGIDPYQQERIKIDVMYKHPDNKKIVDEYKEILVHGGRKGEIDPLDLAKLTRLRTLSIRNNIPLTLFDTLDSLLLRGKRIVELDEPEHIKETRAILESLFLKDKEIKDHIIDEDLIKLLRAKHNSEIYMDMGFENVLLDTGRKCDETARDTNDFKILEDFGYIVTYFDRYDATATAINHLAFMRNVEFTEDTLRSILGNKRTFDKLRRGLFEDLFIEKPMKNKYLTNYGRKKINLLLKGLRDIEDGRASYREVAWEIGMINEEERLYILLHHAIKERMRGFYQGLDTKAGQESLLEEITDEFLLKGILVTGNIPVDLFKEVLFNLRKESFYLNNLLPRIIENKDSRLRDDFLSNSGLDRFYVEGLERSYFEESGLPINLLDEIRKGEGERIDTTDSAF